MRRLQSIDPDRPDPVLIARAAEHLRSGRLVAYPTETFYGLAADPRNPEAVERVFQAKGRPERMALPLIAAETEVAITCYRQFPDSGRRLAAALWPGPLTLVLAAAEDLPPRLLGGGSTVGVRVSSHPVARALARAAGGPIIATSANRSGQAPPQSAGEVEEALGEEVALILDGGPTRGGAASTVLDLTADPPRVVRSGAVPLAELERALGRRLS